MWFLAKAFDFGEIFGNIFSKWYYYVIFIFIILLFVSFFLIKKQPERNNLSPTQKLCYVALLTALATLSNVFDIKISDAWQISLIMTVGFVSGYLFGGKLGFTVCFLGDLIGAIVNPHGAYNPIIGLGTGLWGFVPGVIFSYFKGNKYIKTIVSFIISAIIISGVINTLGIWLMYGLGKKTFVYYLALYPLKLIPIAVNFALSVILITLLDRVLPKNKFNF